MAALPYNCPMPGQACIIKAFRASFTLAAAGYIGAGYAVFGGDLPLGQRLGAVQAEAHADDVRLPLGQTGLHTFAHLDAGILGVQVLQHGVVDADHVHQGQGVSVVVRVQRVGQGHLPLQLPGRPEVHEDLIFNASGRIGRQTHIFVRLEGGDPFDQPDGADREQIVLVPVLGVILFYRR